MPPKDYAPDNPRNGLERYEEIMNFIIAYRKERGFAPSLREIGVKFPDRDGKQTSTSVVRYWIDRMQELDLLQHTPGIPRSIVPISATYRKHVTVQPQGG